MTNYPEKPIWNDDMKFKSATIIALQAFKAQYPYKIGYEKRKEGLQALNRALDSVYGRNVVLDFHSPELEDSFQSHYDRLTDTITMVGKLSIITYLHEYAHALGKDEYGAVKWSLSLFKRVYPIAFEKLNPLNHCMVSLEDHCMVSV